MFKLPFKLFLDLDGVLADFEARVMELTGRKADDQPSRRMWPILANPKHDFYNSLNWMSDGQELWEKTKMYNPTILTGLPMGNWAEAQKRTWCARMLGENVPVITCMARDKHTFARPGDVLVDDRVKAKSEWERVGGVFIHHTSTETSLAQLAQHIQNVSAN